MEHQGLHPRARLREVAGGTDRLREPLRDLGQAEVGPDPGGGDLRGHPEAQGARRVAGAAPAAPRAGVVMSAVELPAGAIEYIDEGDGPPLVLLHGLVMDGELWRAVIDDLRPDHRCIAPTLPLGAHRQPMRRDADLSLRGLGLMVAQFLAALDLRGATVCFSDWNCAPLMVAEGLLDRVDRLVF